VNGQDRQGREGRNPFWDFSLRVYGRDGVAAACLTLQDRHSIDVNLLLFCLWAGHRGHAVTEAELSLLIAATQSWQQNVITPLRAVRRHLKALDLADETLRTHVKDAELKAEEVEQRILFDTLAIADGPGAPGLAGGNAIAYLTALGVAADAADVANLATVLRGCYPDMSPLRAVWAVAG
jgi:uncharacterized protein (TIGR02444 family)